MASDTNAADSLNHGLNQTRDTLTRLREDMDREKHELARLRENLSQQQKELDLQTGSQLPLRRLHRQVEGQSRA
jgi:hypothetical protein